MYNVTINNICKKAMVSLYIFVVVFAPPFMPYPHVALSIVCALIVAIKYKGFVKDVLYKSGIFLFIRNIFLLAFYVILIPIPISMLTDDIVSFSHYLSIINRYGVLVVVVISCIPLLLIISGGHDYNFLIESFIYAGVIEGVCSISAFISPQIKNIFIMLMRTFTGSDLYNNNWYITVRSYGFSRTLVDVFGLGIAIIAGISFFYGITKKRIYIIHSFIIIISAVLNSRTGVVIYFIAVAFSVIYIFIMGSTKLKIKLILSIAIIVLFSFWLKEIISTNQYTYNWVTNGLNSIISMIENGEKNDTFAILFSPNFWKLPDISRSLIGTGHTLYRADGYAHSDVGYINDIWLFGILGSLLQYGTIIYLSINVYKKTNNILLRFSMLYILIAYAIFNIKASVIGYNPGAISMLIVLFTSNYLCNSEFGQVDGGKTHIYG